YFCHQAAEVLGVVRQVVKVGGVKEVGARGNTGTIQNHIQRLSAAERDRVGRDVHIVAGLIAQQLCVEAHQLHRNTKGSKCLVLGDVQISDAQQRTLRLAARTTALAEGDQGWQRLRIPRSAVRVFRSNGVRGCKSI